MAIIGDVQRDDTSELLTPTLSEAHITNNPDLLTTVRFESSCSPDGLGRDEWNEKLFVPLQERIASLLNDAH